MAGMTDQQGAIEVDAPGTATDASPREVSSREASSGSARRAALVGVIGAGVALGVGEFVSALIGAQPSPGPAPELGRLFFSATERADIERDRGKPSREPATVEGPERVTVNGVITRRGGAAVSRCRAATRALLQ